MYSKQVKLVNTTGLHARPASQFVAEAKKYQSKISVRNLDKGSEAPNAKSIILLLTLALVCGTEIEIAADGPDETEAVDALVKLVEAGFGEAQLTARVLQLMAYILQLTMLHAKNTTCRDTP